MRRRAARRGRGPARGSILLETVMAIFLMTVAGLSLIAMIQQAMLATIKAREVMACGRMTQAGFARLKNIDFYDVFAVDSSSSAYGLVEAGAPWTAYPYKAVLDDYKSTLALSKFDRFTLSVVFMRRDSTDSNANGLTSDLVEFSDDGTGKDRYDSAIKYYDQNGDGDTHETYTSGGRTVAEEPDTHIKRVTLGVYRRGVLACSQTELVSLEQFQAVSDPSSESVLSLLVSTPSNNAVLYQAVTADQQASRALALHKSYPDSVVQVEADSLAPLAFVGETAPLATVNLYVGASGVLDTLAADSAGGFSQTSLAVTNQLAEGSDSLVAQATKGGLTSPIAARSVVLDVSPPAVSGATPVGAVSTLAPYVAVTLTDPGLSTTTTSGICPDVTTLEVNGSTVDFTYDAASGKVVWVDSTTNTAPVLAAGTYTAYVEAGDYAGYKTTYTWTFTASITDPDHSAPSIADKSPIGAAGSDLPVISVKVFDNQSGIIPSSIQLTLDGAVVVDSSTVSAAYDPDSGTVSYTPPAAFTPGSSHDVTVTASHFATSPSDKVTSTDAWSFTVP
ncbi:MAG: hypothetical protein KGL53_02275 [Elusimicrobia bacterium]|nr:hypothetical protein [Elusimicrobiota bacterium]